MLPDTYRARACRGLRDAAERGVIIIPIYHLSCYCFPWNTISWA